MDSPARDVFDAIRSIVHALRVGSREAERRVGLSSAQLFVLDRLAGAKRAMSVNELAEATLTHQSSVSVVVQKLEKRGLIERTVSERDRRRLELSLTPRARTLLERAPDLAQDRIISAIEKMPADRQRALGEALGELAQRVATSGSPPAMFFEEDDRSRSPKRSKLKRGKRSAGT